jgi:hypothetical protein
MVMASLEEKLQAAIDSLDSDSAKLHAIVHGDAYAQVSVDGGTVNSVARAIREISESISLEGQGWLSEAESHSFDAAESKDEAIAAIRSIDDAIALVGLPYDTGLAGEANKFLRVNSDESGYEFSHSATTFYGLRVSELHRLELITGSGSEDGSDFFWWDIKAAGLVFEIDMAGHLVVKV